MSASKYIRYLLDTFYKEFNCNSSRYDLQIYATLILVFRFLGM